MANTHRQTFGNRQAQIAMAVLGGLIALIGLSGLASGSPAQGAAFLVFGVASAIRGLRSSSVVVSDEAVETRSMVRTRRYGVKELRGAEVSVGRTGMAGFNREYVVVHRADGRDVAFKELNAKPGPDSVVQQAVAAINQQLPGGRDT